MTHAPRTLASVEDKIAIERTPVEQRWTARSIYEMLSQTVERVPDLPALSFQITSGPKDRAETLTWRELRARVTQTANLLRELGIEEGDVVAYLLPNCNETAITLLAGATAGIVNPINPLLEPSQIAAILRESGAKALVTLAPFPKSDVAQKAAAALAEAPGVKTVLEVDLRRYLGPPLRWIVPFVRPKVSYPEGVRRLDFDAETRRRDGAALNFAESLDPARIGAYFHTGGTTGMPKLAQHDHRGMIYNGWISDYLMLNSGDNVLCPLPLFHVFAAYPILISCVAAGAHMIMPTPAGYRGEGVFDNFWKLVERWNVQFMVMVPTAAAALMQRPVDADVSSLKYALCGSAPLPLELFRQFEQATGVKILEGYGMTEATCLVSCNPIEGQRKVGSVGIPFPYTDVRILHFDEQGRITRECATDEIGEICVRNPGVRQGSTYTDPSKNQGLYAETGHLRTGDLGRIDADGYLWITGRAKDLIIRGGHNIDPALIEEALAGHPAVAFVGAVGQPDAHAGEVPCAYVELKQGAEASADELMAFARERIAERAAHPKHVEVLEELPKTAVGKVFKPDLRKRAIVRVYGEALEKAGISASIHVVEDKRLGLVAELSPAGVDSLDEDEVRAALGAFPRPFRIVPAEA
ncbi:acyl-CoA synthetase [Oceanicella actignis]|uniref:Fatty-acyl-CoA synthase/long-chain acyl-CoA synthetase n=1 Tax=Oceanicella actignis TaxID=1189325 RepID=A0A1M7SF16_9RHOB|nr:acyl-CoA synthetase [Oceanicella actignis]TYO91317.1 fatty-acyl-CoA synthase/long-chain acyl-CoA synthetase [Oceanicella actignis]SET22914.1 long-chain acyl-CoA synthetase [Oceanicella actignis]SHN57077.1 fatty-acyl-CoA synthase/long-chain acyl-CoA synthetase [Oceanicella actignis]